MYPHIYLNIPPKKKSGQFNNNKKIIFYQENVVNKKTRTDVKIPIMNPNLKAICEKYNYNLPLVVDVIINRYIKEILKELSATVPSLVKEIPAKLTMKQKQLVDKGELAVSYNGKGEIIVPRYNCVTTHTARRSGITNIFLSHKYTILQMMHVSGHKTQRPSWITSNSLPTKSPMKSQPLPMKVNRKYSKLIKDYTEENIFLV